MTKSNVVSWEKQILVFYVLNKCMEIIERRISISPESKRTISDSS